MAHFFSKKIKKNLEAMDFWANTLGWNTKKSGDSREYKRGDSTIFFSSGKKGYKIVIFDGNRTAFTNMTDNKKVAMMYLNEAINLW